MIHCEKGEERAAILAICYLVKLWQCRPDFALNHYKSIRPSSLETKEFVELLYQFYYQVKKNFSNLTQQDAKWQPGTEFLGNDLEMFMDQTIPDSYQQRIQF